MRSKNRDMVAAESNKSFPQWCKKRGQEESLCSHRYEAGLGITSFLRVQATPRFIPMGSVRRDREWQRRHVKLNVFWLVDLVNVTN